MISDSSLQSYIEIKQENVVGNQQGLIMDVLRVHPEGLTRNSLVVLSGLRINAVTGRVNELIKKNLLVETDKVVCCITGRMCYLVKIK
jgi:hypothetical protein